MEYEEFREIMQEHVDIGQGIEIHEDDWKIMGNWVRVNNLITLHNISSIRFIDGTEKIKSCVWLNEHCIHLEDLNKLYISKVKRYDR